MSTYSPTRFIDLSRRASIEVDPSWIEELEYWDTVQAKRDSKTSFRPRLHRMKAVVFSRSHSSIPSNMPYDCQVEELSPSHNASSLIRHLLRNKKYDTAHVAPLSEDRLYTLNARDLPSPHWWYHPHSAPSPHTDTRSSRPGSISSSVSSLGSGFSHFFSRSSASSTFTVADAVRDRSHASSYTGSWRFWHASTSTHSSTWSDDEDEDESSHYVHEQEEIDCASNLTPHKSRKGLNYRWQELKLKTNYKIFYMQKGLKKFASKKD